MPTSYPGSLDSLTTSIAASDEMDDSGLEHDLLHNTAHGAINAVEAKVGTGASTAVANSVLGGTGSGTSAWTTGPTLAGTVTAAAFAGPLTGNVTGNASGTAATVTGAAQTAITSVGTLTAATISGDLTVGTSNAQILGPASGAASAGNVSYSFSGDTDTGFFRWNTNTFSAATAGAIRMTWAADGKVGIGTTSPTHPLHISTNDNRPIGIVSTVAGSYLDMRDTNTTGEGYVSIGAVTNDMRLIAGGTTRAAITSAGNVGIGTTSPSVPLHVVGAIRAQAGGDGGLKMAAWPSGSGFAALTTDGMAGSEYCLLSDGTNTFLGSGAGGDTYIRGPANSSVHQLKIGTAAAEFAGYVQTGSNLRVISYNGEGWSEGIRIVVASGSWGGIRMKRTNNTSAEIGNWYMGYQNNATHDFAFGCYNTGQIDNILYLKNSNGNVGINTAIPNAKLTVQGGLGIGDSSPISSTDGGRRSIQIATDTSYGGTFNHHSGFRIHTRLNAGGWASPSIHFDGASNWGTYGNTDWLVIGHWNGTAAHFRSRLIYDRAYSSGSEVRVDGIGDLYRYSSSARYKTDIEDLWDAEADKVLDLRPVWFRSTGGLDRSDWSWEGFIAEEVAAINPRWINYGPVWETNVVTDELTGETREEFVNNDDGERVPVLDEDGNEVLRPEGVQYGQIVPALVNLIRRQKTQITELVARVEALEATHA